MLVSPSNPLTLNYSLGWAAGVPHVQVLAKDWTSNSACVLAAKVGTVTTNYSLQAGLNDAVLQNVPPGGTITELKILCTAGSFAVDSLQVADGAAFAPPIQDLHVTGWKSMYTPGRQQAPHVARASPDGTYLLIATQSGMAWTDDEQEWHMANGNRVNTLQYLSEVIWADLLMVDGPWYPRVWGINAYPTDYAESDGGDSFIDGLYYSDDMGDHWTLSIDGFWSGIRHSDCLGTEDRNDFSSGALLAQLPTTGHVLALENGIDEEVPDRGLYLHDENGFGADQACDAVTGLPKKLGSALVITQDATDTLIAVVGFRPVYDPDGLLDTNTLYACTLPATTDCSGFHEEVEVPGACLPILGASTTEWSAEFTPDVRDIEAEPPSSNAGVIFVADGGERHVGAGVWEWDASDHDTTVFRVDLSGVDLQAELDASATYVVADIVDTDPYGSGEPTWVDESTTLLDTCGATVYDGNLVTLAPGVDLGAIATLALDPQGGYLFASYQAGFTGLGRHYTCPTLFRYDTDDPSALWQPMSETGIDDAADMDNRTQRRAMTYGGPDPYAEEPMYETFPDRTIATMAFVGDPLEPELFLGGYTGWIIPSSVYSWGGGWDADEATHDLDTTVFEIAWTDDVPGWDIYDAQNLAVCHQCAISDELTEEKVDVVAATNPQSAGWYAYAEDSTGHREPGDFDCHWNIMGVGTNAEAMWEDPAGFGSDRLPTQHWRAFGPAGGKASGDGRGIVFAEWDDTLGWTTSDLGTPCWDAYAAFADEYETIDATTFGLNHEALECSDGSPTLPSVSWDEAYYEPWFACADGDATTAPTQKAAGIGVITAIEAVAQDVAFALTEAPCVMKDTNADDILELVCSTDGNANTGGGLWFLYRPPTGGAIQYLHIPADLSELDPDDNTGTTCVENFADETATTAEYQLGEDLLLGPPMVQVDRNWFAAGTGTTDEHELRAFVATRNAACGLVEVRALLQYDSTFDTWSVNGAPTFWEMDYDGDTTSATAQPTRSFAAAGCKPFAGVDEASGFDRADDLNGIELTPDGRWLLVYGGNAYTQGSAVTPYLWSGGSTMGVCAIRVGDTRVDPVTVGTQMWPETNSSGTEPNPDPFCLSGLATCGQVAVPYHAEQAITRDVVWTPTSLVANPFVAGTWYGGVNTTSCTDPDCDGRAQAPFVLQRRPRATAPYYMWSFKPWPIFDGTDGDLEMPWAASMQWGVSEASGSSVDRIYHGAAIGGMWEGQLTW